MRGSSDYGVKALVGQVEPPSTAGAPLELRGGYASEIAVAPQSRGTETFFDGKSFDPGPRPLQSRLAADQDARFLRPEPARTPRRRALLGPGTPHPSARIGRAIASSRTTRPRVFQPRSYCGGTGRASVRPSAAAARSGQ